SLERPWQALQFLLRKSVPEYGKVFEEVSEDKMKPGDIVLFRMTNSIGKLRSSFKHAAVYCGDGEVIHFQNRRKSKKGKVSKEGFTAMKDERGKCQVYRKIDGINLETFRSKVRAVMNGKAKYDLCQNNCIHFALYLLDMAEFYF
ncbi:hypothetical protein N320_04808, partial [Buceros rhinoceros silvestris]